MHTTADSTFNFLPILLISSATTFNFNKINSIAMLMEEFRLIIAWDKKSWLFEVASWESIFRHHQAFPRTFSNIVKGHLFLHLTYIAKKLHNWPCCRPRVISCSSFRFSSHFYQWTLTHIYTGWSLSLFDDMQIFKELSGVNISQDFILQ